MISVLKLAVKKSKSVPSLFAKATEGSPQMFTGGPRYVNEAIVVEVGGFLTS